MKQLLITAWILALPPAVAAQDIPLSKILVDKEEWREVAKNLPGITLLEAEPTGSIAIFQKTSRSVRLSTDGRVEKVKPAADEMITRNERVVIAKSGAIYSIAWGSGWVDFISLKGKKETRAIFERPGIGPNCLTLWPDEGHLVIGPANGAYLWAVRIEKDGSFGPGDRYYSLRTKPIEKTTIVTAMIMDAGYLLYACTPLGIQVFDPTGRLSGVIAAPSKDAMTAITIGGEKADTLFVAAGNKIFARRIQGKAIYSLKK